MGLPEQGDFLHNHEALIPTGQKNTESINSPSTQPPHNSASLFLFPRPGPFPHSGTAVLFLHPFKSRTVSDLPLLPMTLTILEESRSTVSYNVLYPGFVDSFPRAHFQGKAFGRDVTQVISCSCCLWSGRTWRQGAPLPMITRSAIRSPDCFIFSHDGTWAWTFPHLLSQKHTTHLTIIFLVGMIVTPQMCLLSWVFAATKYPYWGFTVPLKHLFTVTKGLKNYYPSIYLSRVNQQTAGRPCQITQCLLKRKFFFWFHNFNFTKPFFFWRGGKEKDQR